MTVLDTAAETASQPQETFGTAGTIENVVAKDGTVSQIEIKGARLAETAPDHVILNIDNATSLVNQKGEAVKANN